MGIHSVAPERLVAVDLRDLSEEQMAALRQSAIKESMSLSDLVAKFIGRASLNLVGCDEPEDGITSFPSQVSPAASLGMAAGANPNETTEPEEGIED